MKAFEPRYLEFKADYMDEIASEQTALAVKVPTENGVAGVLSVCANAVITGGEALGGEASYSGSLQIKVLYLTSDGQPEYSAYQSDFSGKITDGRITPSTAPMFSAKVADCTVGGYSGSEISVTAVVEVGMSVITDNTVKYLAGADGAEVREELISYCGVAAHSDGTKTATGSADVKDILSGVLTSCASAVVKNCSAGLDCIVFGGDIFVTVAYRTDAESCNVKTLNLEIPFKDEIEALGALVGQSAKAEVSIKSVRVIAEVDEEMSRSKITAEVEYEICGVTYAENVVSAAVDIFSADTDFIITYSDYFYRCYDGLLNFSERVSTGFELDDETEIDKILGVSKNSVNVASTYYDGEKIVVEGVVTSTVLCCVGDSIKSFDIESPFSISQNADGISEGSVFSAEVAVSACSAKHKRTKQIDLQLELDAGVNVFRLFEGKVISDVVVAGQKMPPECSIEVYVASGGEQAWDVARQIGVLPREIAAQNPELEFPLSAGDKVLVYHCAAK